MNKQNQTNIPPDFTFEDKYYLKNPLDEKTKKKEKLITWCISEIKFIGYKDNMLGDDIIEFILEKRANFLYSFNLNILSLEMNIADFTELILTKKYSNFIDPTTSKEILQTGLFASIFDIPIYVIKNNTKVGHIKFHLEEI